MLVRPKEAFMSTLPDIPNGVTLTPSDTLRDDNPHVKARPDMFEEVTETFRGAWGTGVEAATARPGEKRSR
jgi:hypothetical protein